MLAGFVAFGLAASGRFLPHDERFLDMTAADLCALHGCRIAHFMIHDRVSFGGALVALGLIYVWLVEVPLKHREPWAWWLILVTGVEGFGSFFAFLGYGYLDAWHAAATLFLAPCFAAGLALSHRTLRHPADWRSLLRPSMQIPWYSTAGIGRAILLAAAAGLIGGGATILAIGATSVFVPEDLRFLGVTVDELRALNPRLVPLIAHDRAGFGGAVCCFGLLVFFLIWCCRLSKSLWGVLGLSGAIGFTAAIAVHPAIGYNDVVHLAPAVIGAILYAVGLMTYRPLCVNNPLDDLAGE
ncbi:MAG: hypothetical protein P4L84_23035 [Isosphaeraceae bacterium]|nr:hypothetical protein [Isosphaeraceae bacterium]